MHILVLEAYDGGSHGNFLDGLIGHSGHRFTRVGLPPRKWKWRMRGSAIYFADEVRRRLPDATGGDSGVDGGSDFDLVFTSDMTAGADLRALLPGSVAPLPMVCYFHENQLTYPVPDEAERDYQYGFTNITSCLAADAVWFNSRYHRDDLLRAAGNLLRKMPDFVPAGIVERIEGRAAVMPLGLNPQLFEGGSPPTAGRSVERSGPVRILWNHRWEYDKNPDEFFEVLFDLDRSGVDFRLLVAGESFRESPAIFEAARKALAHRIDHFGYLPDRQGYLDLLGRADVVVSTAVHEFFGLSVMEAVAAGAYPVLPRRLSYPELLPVECHGDHLYADGQELRDKLARLCREGVPRSAGTLREMVSELSWERLIGRYDAGFEKVVRSG